MINIIFGIVIIIALILGVYIFGIYTANRGNKNIDIEITIFYYVVLSFIIVFGFMFLFERIGFKQEEIGVSVAITVIFTSIFCANRIITQIKKLKDIKE